MYKKFQLLVAAAVFYIAGMHQVAFSQQAPHLEKRGKVTQLIVNNKPFVVLGGELYNSSTSNLEYMAPLWAPLKQMNLNTVLAAVSWELIEPEEGKFDFSLVDGILKGARENNLHIVLLWFGTWKNGLSHYAPAWVKQDVKRFPRIVLNNGETTETISALSNAAQQADAKAFAALMQHVKAVDAQQQTVIMVQVENEVGVIGGTRDHSAVANAAFAKPVPTALLQHLKANYNELQPALRQLWDKAGNRQAGTWAEVFGQTVEADEAFMAWHYANYLNAVAKAGKAQYNLPMFVNAWVVQPEDKKPGDYPGGGPQAHEHDIWRAGAPMIDIKSPDIYLPDFKGIVSLYHHPWNPLFIPESFAGDDGAANAFYAIGAHSGIGYSPFGIDRKTESPSTLPVAKAYRILQQLTSAITAAQAAGNIMGINLTRKDSVQQFSLGGYTVTATLRKNWKGVVQVAKGYGLIIFSGADEFTVAGSNIDVSFEPITSAPAKAGLLWVREGYYQDGSWKPGRLLNGDDIMMNYDLAGEAAAGRTGTGARLGEEPTILKVKLYRF